jgi:hypothetical protein
LAALAQTTAKLNARVFNSFIALSEMFFFSMSHQGLSKAVKRQILGLFNITQNSLDLNGGLRAD